MLQLGRRPPPAAAVPAKQTVTADFSKVQKTTPTPVPGQCGQDKVTVRFTVTYDGGKVGPVTSAPTTFQCAY